MSEDEATRWRHGEPTSDGQDGKDGLVDRLRHPGIAICSAERLYSLCNEAADRIADLTRQLDRERAANRSLNEDCKACERQLAEAKSIALDAESEVRILNEMLDKERDKANEVEAERDALREECAIYQNHLDIEGLKLAHAAIDAERGKL